MTEHDPAAPHFAPLLANLQTIAARHDYDDPTLRDHVVGGARAARAAGVAPEYIVAYLRRRLRDAPLSAVGDWYRGVIIDRLVVWAIEAYFDVEEATE